MRKALFFSLVLIVSGILIPLFSVHADFLSPDERARLEAQYAELQKEIAEWQKVLDDTQAKKNSLQGDVTALNAQIKKAQAEIKQRTISITGLTAEINARSKTIKTLDQRVARGQESLAAMLRTVRETDDSSIAEVLLSSHTVSDFFTDADALLSIEGKLSDLFGQLHGAKTQAQSERDTLAKKQDAELDARHDVEVKKKAVSQSEAEKQALLTITKNQEQQYQKVLADRQQQAAKIRAALFPLRDTQGIAFGTALDYAATASQKTGVRAAFILAILSQESDLGKNVGSCFVSNLSTGDGVGKNSGTSFSGVMKAPRDTAPFQQITAALGLVWSTTPVSCPVSGGYGGAMGPSQFIPSTWVLYQSRLSKALGVSTPNPWDAKDAIMATALYMSDLGASGGSYSAERNAACKYYSGRSCDSKKPANTGYGDSVMAKTDAFQDNIDFLKGV
jgi:peptidoglycan hydrolase CwlO-like protein